MIEQFFATHSFNLIQFLLVAIGYLMPIPLAFLAFHLWHDYRQDRFIMGIKWVLLEIQVPREVIKSPAAMELIFSNALYHQSFKGFWEEFIIGAPWMWFSLEIASIDGRVHFYIRTPTRIRDLVETQIYAQYPQAKVVEVDDYAFDIPQYKKDGDWNMWGCEFAKRKEDFLPIKTYKNFGDDLKTGVKEEFKIDPITPIIEYLGSLPKGQQVWIQIIVRQNIIKYHSHNTGGHITFAEAANEYIENMLAPYTRTQKNDNIIGTFGKQINVPEQYRPVIKAITDVQNQIHFDCGIRLITLADKKLHNDDSFNNLRRSSRLMFRQFSMPGINELWRVNSTQFDAPWSDPTGLALTKIKKRMLDFYRLRVFFHPPLQYNLKYPPLLSIFFPSGKPQLFVLSIEELATLFHFPGMVSETPSFKRVDTKIAKPPSNLPV
ncbi:TPA: hypothetical protein DIC38_02335 [Candidatus Nomurabacteria bacterium]|nr:MAG: hypothetical protein O210_OD1C00001G0264 [Parcubacteria bacterium RAAC4_OD1_1]HCY26492.1 hypothetical protein [Candidatus Nomurabacteria bacterium]